MSLELKQLFEIPGEVREFSYKIDLSEYELFDGKPFKEPFTVTGKLENRAGVVSLEYSFDFFLKTSCDRCLDEFQKQYSYSFSHNLVTELNTDNDEYILLKDYVLDLDELVLSDVLLALPSKMLCKDDCKGLCETCGANLNHGSCSCKEKAGKQVDPRLAVLGELLK